MPTKAGKKTKTVKKARATTSAPTKQNDDLGQGLYGLAQALSGVAREVEPLWHIETLADHVGHLASALRDLAHATALSVIAQYGTSEERATVVASLRRSYSESFE